jgi:glycine dehydrogenase subunit 2
MVNVGRPSRPDASASDAQHKTLTGGRGLLQDEPLIFELGGWEKTGVDLPEPDLHDSEADWDLGELVRTEPIGLPGLSEPEAMRHYVRLSQKNHAIDLAMYPLGSCTMKHNPRLNERMARLPGFADLHPLQPQSTVQGALELMDSLAHWLKTLTGMPAVALSPRPGPTASCAACWRSAPRMRRRGRARARRCWCRPRRTAPTRRRPPSSVTP